MKSQVECIEIRERDLVEKEKCLKERECALEMKEFGIRDFSRSVQVSQTEQDTDLEKKATDLGKQEVESTDRSEITMNREKELADSLNNNVPYMSNNYVNT